MADKSREIRIGLVLYGGVSLAIYINGVAREFHRAVRGEGIYRVIKALTDSDITVDILSGTSAGGINGILLAHALVNGGDFKSTAALWREHGDIANLVREPRGSTDANSLLDGDGYFRPRLRDAFQKLEETASAGHGTYDDPSPVSELDLFVTSTDVHGDVYTWFDDQGHAVDVKDHHAVFRLKHRATLAGGGRDIRYTDFAPNPDTDLALAKLGRMTSCFPAAFPPVQVAKDTAGDTAEARADAKLRTWGQLAADRDYFFLDGGVLDNKPFSYTTRQIFFRLADRDVRRWLFYVEPDPESFTPPAQRHLVAPSLVGAALAALLTIPGYESIGGDLRAIAERNADIERFNTLWQGIEKGASDRASSPVVAGLRAREERDAGGPPVTADARGALDGIYMRARLMALTQRAILGVLRRNGLDQVTLEPSERRARAKLVRDFFDHEEAEPLDTLHDFDIYFRLRRLLHLLYLEALTGVQARMPPSDGAGDTADDPVRAMCRALASQVDLLQVVLAYMERTVDGAELRKAPGGAAREAADVWNLVEAVFSCLLHPVLSERLAGERQVPGVAPALPLVPDSEFLSLLAKALAARSDRLIEIAGKMPSGMDAAALRQAVFRGVYADCPTGPERPTTLLRRHDVRVRELLEAGFPDMPELTDALKMAYQGFLALDEVMFPVQKDPLVFERDVIRVVRVSPKDAALGLSNVPDFHDKVAGDVLGHFGAFFKRSWRSNDILWGRLDGLCQITETLLEPERLKQVLKARGWPAKLAELVGVDDLKRLFPSAAPERLAALQASFAAAVGAARAAEQAGKDVADSVWEPFRNQLIEAGHNEVLADDLPTVIRDAAAQALIWNNLPVAVDLDPAAAPVTLDPGRLIFRQGERPLDPTLAALLAESACAAPLLGPGASGEADRVEFFKDHYRVGKETVAGHIPPEVLARTVTKALAVAHRALLNSVPEKVRSRVAGLGSVKLAGRAIGFANGLSGLYADGSTRRRTLLTVAWTLALAALALGVGAGMGVVHPGGAQGLFWTLLAVPVVGLVLWGQFKGAGAGAAVRLALGIGVGALAIWKATELIKSLWAHLGG